MGNSYLEMFGVPDEFRSRVEALALVLGANGFNIMDYRDDVSFRASLADAWNDRILMDDLLEAAAAAEERLAWSDFHEGSGDDDIL